MDYAILIFIDLVMIISLWIKVRVAMTYAGTPSYGHFGMNPEGTEDTIDRRFGLTSVAPRMFMIGLLTFFIITLYKVGHPANACYSAFFGDAIEQRDRDQEKDSTPEEELNEPSLEGKGDMTVRSIQLYDEQNLHPINGQPTEAPARPRDHTAAPRNTPDVNEKIPSSPDMAAYRQKTPEGGSKFWLTTITGSEEKAIAMKESYHSIVAEVNVYRDPEHSFWRVRIGPFTTRKEAQSVRNTYNCKCLIHFE